MWCQTNHFHALLLLILSPSAYASHHSSPVEDFAAFPKYAVRFLNGLPIDNDTAHLWLATGLQGGLRQFLGESAPSIDSGPQSAIQFNDYSGKNSNDTLQFMRMGRDKAFLCHVPPPPPIPPPFTDNGQEEVPAIKSWQLLSALAGSCLYHRQGWFTYSYCHNLHVRQFRELASTQPTAGLQVPEEDNQWESFTLGRSPTADQNQDLVATEETALAQNLEVARGARERYLIQRWGDGTVCDKTGRRREIEVQFHCSISTMDSIILVKETSTCKYVLVIHTPRLCEEPGFKSRAEHNEEAVILCREVMDHTSEIVPSLEQSLHPRRQYLRHAIAGSQPTGSGNDKDQSKEQEKLDFAKTDDKVAQNILTKLYEKIMSNSKDSELSVISIDEDEEGRQYILVEGDENLLAKFAEPVARQKEDDEAEDQEESSTQRKNDRDHTHYDL